jgi:hypothetical protein
MGLLVGAMRKKLRFVNLAWYPFLQGLCLGNEYIDLSREVSWGQSMLWRRS